MFFCDVVMATPYSKPLMFLFIIFVVCFYMVLHFLLIIGFNIGLNWLINTLELVLLLVSVN